MRGTPSVLAMSVSTQGARRRLSPPFPARCSLVVNPAKKFHDHLLLGTISEPFLHAIMEVGPCTSFVVDRPE
jgi:hypothetical protein